MQKLIYLNDDLDTTVERILQDDELQGCGLGKRKVARALKSFYGDEIAASVFLKKYALRDADNQIIEFTLDEAKDRWAGAVAGVENLQDISFAFNYFRELYEYMLPAGRQMFALGNDYVRATYSNCYVTKIQEDSIEGIFGAAQKMARTFSYGGGVGLCIGELRPADSKVSNSARFSTGAASFMELYSMTTNLIGQCGRRGACMLTIPVNHPDVEQFVNIKHNNTDKVKHANISIKLSDEFMKAVEEDKDFILCFGTHHETIEKTIKARDLWQKIIQSARDSAEPGLMFWDRMAEMSPSDSYSNLQIHATNPCGELPLEPGGNCVLSSILLHKFVNDPYTENANFNMPLFQEMVRRGVRHLDNVVELNIKKHPLEEQVEASRMGRRIGLGITGLADMFAAMGIKYGSDESINFANNIMNAKKLAEYEASSDLAAERGSFPLFDPNIHFKRGFCSELPEKLIEKIKREGLRNVSLSTIAPNGSLSIIAQCSSGCEPIFAMNYKRNVMLGKSKKKEFTVHHPGVIRYFNVAGPGRLPDCWVTAHDIDYKRRIVLQGVLQKHVDSSISSTINLPKDIDAQTVGDIYFAAWKEGLKGITVYREGSREGILITEDFAKEAGLPNMDTVIYCVRAEGGDKFYIIVSYKDKIITKPYQVFVMNYKKADTDAFVKIGNSLVKMLRERGVNERRVQKYLDRSSNSLVKLTRFLSLSMKTGHLEDAMEILDEHAFAGTLATRLYEIFSDSIAAKQALCPICKSDNVKMEEGCVTCLDCNWSRCT